MVYNGEIKIIKKENNNQGFGSSKGGGSNGNKPQGGQLTIEASPPNPTSNVSQNNQVNAIAQLNHNQAQDRNQRHIQ